MIGIDTNILLYALHPKMKQYEQARQFVESLASSNEVVIAELVLVELYQLIRNPIVFGREVSASEAENVIQTFRKNPRWKLVENAPVMSEVWKRAGKNDFARRRLFDLRLAFTLQHHGVTHFATANIKDFLDLGFQRVWSPLIEEM